MDCISLVDFFVPYFQTLRPPWYVESHNSVGMVRGKCACQVAETISIGCEVPRNPSLSAYLWYVKYLMVSKTDETESWMWQEASQPIPSHGPIKPPLFFLMSIMATGIIVGAFSKWWDSSCQCSWTNLWNTMVEEMALIERRSLSKTTMENPEQAGGFPVNFPII